MCGIAGIIDFSRREDRAPAMRRMLRALQHRGPDATGVYQSGHAALAHARLSIIDLAGGHQPMANEGQTVWIVFNGEIFNYPELRTELIGRGHRFATQSDTEVIVHLYEEHGSGLFTHLNGQFALAVWDQSKQELLLGRDRMGIRPLFYHLDGPVLHFASEIKALFTDRRIPRRLDAQTLADVFTCWTPVDPLTAFEGIRQLPPAHFAVFNRHGLHCARYWQLDFTPDLTDRSETERTEELNSLLLDAARIRLRADVPVGAYLSGGIDSTFISTMVKRHFNNRLHPCAVEFSDHRFDERRFQNTAVAALKTDHRSVRCTEQDIAAAFPQVIWHAEAPLIRTAPAPLMLLSKLVRQSGFKVVLTGEGADEIFAGYNIFKEAKIRRFWARHPESACRPHLLRRLYPYIFDDRNQPRAFLFGFFKKGLQDTASPVYSHLVRWQNTVQLQSFFNAGYLPQADLGTFAARIVGTLPKAFGCWHPLGQAQYLESTLFLSNYLLSSQGDRMAMANSVEGRFPFLDYRVVERAARLPADLRLHGLTEKYILKQIARNQVPDDLIRRPKQPYRAPISRCFSGPAAPDWVHDLLSERSLKRAGCFDPARVGHLAEKCRQPSGLSSERENMALAAILSTQLLDHQFIRNFPEFDDAPMPHTVDVRQDREIN